SAARARTRRAPAARPMQRRPRRSATPAAGAEAASGNNRRRMSASTGTAQGQDTPATALECRDPATGELLATVAATPPERVEEVARSVAKVQRLWALLRVKDRAGYMRR